MFKLLKKSANNKVVVAETKQQIQYPEIVTKIHKEFDTAGEKLLQEAIEILNDCKLRDKEKGKLLFRLGFINTPQAKEVQEVEQKEKLAQENADLINYYSQKYPFNKFVSEEITEQICGKYKLVCGDVSLYKGFVPADKLKLIADFKIDKKDTQVTIWSIGNYSTCKGEELNDGGAMASRYCIYDRKEKLEPLKICAPLSQMKMTGYKLFGIHIVKEVPDPIVLQPVNGGYLIVCAWGNEANDELVVNSINN